MQCNYSLPSDLASAHTCQSAVLTGRKIVIPFDVVFALLVPWHAMQLGAQQATRTRMMGTSAGVVS